MKKGRDGRREAALGMSLSSLLVVANAARLVKEKSAGEGSEP